MDCIFDEYIIVDEKSVNDFFIAKMNCYGGTTNKFIEVTQFAALEFQAKSSDQKLEISDIGNDSQAADMPLAQIILWQWNNEKGTQEIKKTQILNKGGTFCTNLSSSPVTIVIRILQKRQKTDENPCPPLGTPAEDDFTVQIGGSKLAVSAACLMDLSPSTKQMIITKMKEKRERKITLDDLGENEEQFKEILRAAISAKALQSSFFPNPTNVLALLKLADFFQVDWLKTRCEQHLFNCVEIPLIDRFLLIEPYRLDNLKMFIMHLDVENLRTFFKANRDLITPKMPVMAEFAFRLCG